jgi:hypothetical protein
MLWLAIAACTYRLRLNYDSSVPDEITWSGYVLEDLSGKKDLLLLEDDGAFEVVDLDDEPISDGEHSGDGYWFVDVPTDVDVAVRISGAEHVSSLWRAHTPSGRAYWLTGALFTQYTVSFDAFLKALEGVEGLDPADLSEGTVVHLWGQPLDPDAWAGAVVTATGGDGADVPMFTFAIDEKNLVTEAGDQPVSFFFGANAVPVDVTLRVETVDGRVAETTYPARGGDLVTAAFFDVGESQ